MDVTIHAVAERHVDGLHRAFDIVAKEKKYLGSLAAPPMELISENVRRNIDYQNPQLVASNSGEVVGWCEIIRLKKPLFRHVGILEIGLLPHWRGKGIGRSLVEAAINAAFDRGFARIELTVFASNQHAADFYKKIGFSREGELVDAVCVDGAFSNSILMGLTNRHAKTVKHGC
ncbi:MAG: GNAT family N-acetyltransferase [Paracoccaceae bacterium]